MLSPESWCGHVPDGGKELLIYREWVLDRCRADRSFRRGVWYACKSDIFYFIRVFVFQFNPRLSGREVEPFLPWDFQVEAVRALLDAIECHCHESAGVHQHDLLWEKSREMGATWLFLIVALWLVLFHDNKQVLMISRNEDAVFGKHPADADSLFWKLRFVLGKLPRWLTGGVDWKKKAVTRGTSGITGEASTGKAGVGGRATVMFIDEFSQIAEDFEVLGRTSDTTGCRVFNGTHKGLKTAFFGLTQRADLRKIVMHWTQHPEKRKGLYKVGTNRKLEVLDVQHEFPPNYPYVLDGTPAGGPRPGWRSPWYDEQCRRKGNARDVAMDLDIDPRGSDSQYFDPLRVRALIEQYACPPYWEGDFVRDNPADVKGRLVASPGGRIKLWMQPHYSGTVPPGYYTFGCDVAAGTGATPSCLSGMNDRGEKVFEMADPHVDPDEFAELTVGLCRLFHSREGEPAKLIWEQAGPGIKFGQRVLDLDFRHIYYRTEDLKLNPQRTDQPGWYPQPKHKRLLLESYRAALYNHRLVNRSEAALDELNSFVFTDSGTIDHSRQVLKNDPSGSRENHGDRVIADALMWKMGEYRVVEREEAVVSEPVVGTFAWRKMLADRKRQADEAWA